MVNVFVTIVVIIYSILVFLQFIYGANLVYLSILAKRAKRIPVKRLTSHPHVTIQLPMYNERHVATRLIDAACKIKWPKEKLQIQVLDDSTDDTTKIVEKDVARWKAKGFDIELLHRKNRKGFKAGALDEGMDSCKGEFVAIFDADFIPGPEFLEKTIPHFENKKVAMVQTRWSYINRGYSILTKVQAVVLDAHFAVDQEARYHNGYFFNFNGTAGVWRSSAIGDAGGWKHDTLVEDLDLTYRAQLKGWKCVYLNDVGTKSEIPITMNALRLQQQRWAKGNFQCAAKLLKSVWKTKMPLMRRLQASYHLTTYSFQLVSFIVILFFPLMLYLTKVYFNVSINAPTLILVGTFFAPGFHFVTGQKKLGKFRARFKHIFFTSLVAPGLVVNTVYAFFTLVFTRDHPFERTPKFGALKGAKEWIKNSYLQRVSPVLKYEMLFWLYITGTIIYAISTMNWLYVVYSLVFFTGTTAMIVFSLLQAREQSNA